MHTGLRAAHLLYVASTATELVDLMEDTLVIAKAVSAEHKNNLLNYNLIFFYHVQL